MSETIVDVDGPEGEVQVIRRDDGRYDVLSGGVVRHPDASAETVMRALGFYIHGTTYALKKLQEKTATQ